MKKSIMLSLGLFLVFAVAAVYGQVSLKANIDFPFTVGSKVLPAGEYQFLGVESGSTIRVQGEGKTGALAVIQTRLSGATHQTPQDSHLVFDKVGDKYTLSEVWIPGEDGYLVWATKGKHEHKTLNVNN
jgi:hypothetical protein